MIARFEIKIEPLTDGCWRWTAGHQVNGYGCFAISHGEVRRAHRVAYELFVGDIPPGLTIDHLCRRRDCVNPTHLEPVTNRENLLRSNGWSGRNARVTHCPQGHRYTAANTNPRRGARECRECARIYQRELRRRRKEKAA